MNDPLSPALVRRACHELLAEGKNPSRPLVQELLAREDYIGRKGSNSLVQRLINEWRQDVGAQLTRPTRSVEGVPEEFVSKMDGLLAEMMALARKMVVEEFDDQRRLLEKEREDIRSAIDQAEQLRLRTEGELTGIQGTISEMRDHARQQLDEIEKLRQQLKNSDVILKGKESEIGYLTSQCSELQKQLVQVTNNATSASANHQAEIERQTHASGLERARLMQQLDDAKQTAKREVQSLQDGMRNAQSEAAEARTQLEKIRVEHASALARLDAKEDAIAQLQAENARLLAVEKVHYATTARLNVTEAALQESKAANSRLSEALNAMQLERVSRFADAEKLIAWMDDPERKGAARSFTEGPERQIAHRFEAMSKAAKE